MWLAKGLKAFKMAGLVAPLMWAGSEDAAGLGANSSGEWTIEHAPYSGLSAINCASKLSISPLY